MKPIYILTLILCHSAITLSCDPNTHSEQKQEPEVNIEIPDSLKLDSIETITVDNSTIEIYTTINRDKSIIYEFWFKDHKQIHSVHYSAYYEINYKWLVDIDNDKGLEVIRAQGYEDGVNYGIYDTKRNSEQLLLVFNPALLDERYPDRTFWGYPWDMQRLAMNPKKQILASLYDSHERDDNYSTPEKQEQMPYIFFYGKTTQPEAEIEIEPSKKGYLSLKKIIAYAFLPGQNQFRVPDDFYIHDSASVVAKNVSYKIVSLEKISEKNDISNSHFGLPIIILRNNILVEKNVDLVFGNDDNCPADTYDGMFAEGNYFTIQQIFCVDFLFVRSNTTFKIDPINNEITLYNYAEEYTDRSNPDRPIPVRTWTSTDFGNVLFQETTESFLKTLRQTKPKFDDNDRCLCSSCIRHSTQRETTTTTTTNEQSTLTPTPTTAPTTLTPKPTPAPAPTVLDGRFYP